jgi:hypothetical protein
MDDGRSLVSGGLFAANEARFTSSNYSEPLTQYVVGWQDPANLEELLAFLAPAVPNTPRRFEFKKATNSEAFLTETDDVRAIGSAFKRVEQKGETVTDKTHNKGLTTRVDHDDVLGDDWRERKVAWLKSRLLRNEVIRAIALIDAASTNLAKTWDADADPDADVRDSLRLATNSSGIRPNRLAIGEGAWDKRYDAYVLGDNPGRYTQSDKTPEELARKLGIDVARVISARYQSSSSAKSKVLDAIVYAFLAEEVLDKDDPSNIKRFVSPTQQGAMWGVYIEEFPKYTDITVEHYSNIVITSTLGIRKLTIS